MEQLDYLSIYSKDCLGCGHFIDSLPKTNKSCLFSKGNKECPASEITIVITGHLKSMAKNLVAARANKDPKAESAILSKIAKEPEDTKATFYLLLEQAERKK